MVLNQDLTARFLWVDIVPEPERTNLLRSQFSFKEEDWNGQTLNLKLDTKGIIKTTVLDLSP